MLVKAGNQSGSRTSAAQAEQADVLALAGCDEPSPTCWDQVRRTLGVDAVIVGTVSPSAEPPGTVVELTMYRENTEPASRTYTLEATEPAAIESEFKPVATTVFTGEEVVPTPDLPPPTPHARGGRIRFDAGRVKKHSWIIAGAGAGSAVVGGAFLIVAGNRQDAVDSAPTATVEDLEELEDLENSGKRFTLLGNALFIAGSLAAITGGVLIGIQGIVREPTESPPVSIGPMMSRDDVVGLSLGGSF